MSRIFDIITFPVDFAFWLLAVLCCVWTERRSFAISNFPATILWHDIFKPIRVIICLIIYYLIYHKYSW